MLREQEEKQVNVNAPIANDVRSRWVTASEVVAETPRRLTSMVAELFMTLERCPAVPTGSGFAVAVEHE